MCGSFQCHYCKKPCPRHKRTRDHQIALALGGEEFICNIVYSCENCNKRKGKFETPIIMWVRSLSDRAGNIKPTYKYEKKIWLSKGPRHYAKHWADLYRRFDVMLPIGIVNHLLTLKELEEFVTHLTLQNVPIISRLPNGPEHPKIPTNSRPKRHRPKKKLQYILEKISRELAQERTYEVSSLPPS